MGVNFGPKRPQKSIIGPKMALFWGVDPRYFTVPLGYCMPHVHLKFEPNPPKNAREMAKKRFFLWFFFSYLALARQEPLRIQVFFAYSCSHRAYGSNGVSHAPNLVGEPPLKWPQTWSGRDFGVKMTPKGLKKLQTAISRPFLVQMSWFFAWGFVFTYSVGKYGHQPPAHPPVRAAARPTAFRRKLSNSTDIRRGGWQSYNLA